MRKQYLPAAQLARITAPPIDANAVEVPRGFSTYMQDRGASFAGQEHLDMRSVSAAVGTCGDLFSGKRKRLKLELLTCAKPGRRRAGEKM